jgi:tRNA modification GTPase
MADSARLIGSDMRDLNDTIVAVSSPSGGVRSILRISGPQARGAIPDLKSEISDSRIVSARIRITDSLTIDARLYLFVSPHSYTGDDLVEIHVEASEAIVAALMESLLATGLRAAEPGEFTARAYLNGKLDLAQAEAVNEIISSSNRLQLDAAERLLAGRLKDTIEAVRAELMDCLSRVEAGLDFSDGDTGPLKPVEPALAGIVERLETLLAESVRCQTLVDLPAVGLAGVPNAGKSSLLNALLGRPRSIVSHEPMTTRDVLTGVLSADRFQCVLFDCAGLTIQCGSSLDELARRAAVAALRSCQLVLFCVDMTKTDWTDELAIRASIRTGSMIHVATKSDLLPHEQWPRRMQLLAHAFSDSFLPTSARTGQGLRDLVGAIEGALRKGQAPADASASAVTLTARHRQTMAEAIDSLRQALAEVRHGRDEVAALMIRSGYQALSQIEQQHIDEEILDRIFSQFCLGK